MYNKRLKNEIKSECHQCGAERTLAYWDEELEHYIYLCDEPENDEPVLCTRCMSENGEHALFQVQSSKKSVSVEVV